MKNKPLWCSIAIFTLLLSVRVCIGAGSESRQSDYSPFPNPDAGYVTDIANILTHEQEEEIESWLYTTEKRTNVEIVVVVIDSIQDYPGTPNNSIEKFATGLFDTYGIGNMTKNNGVLLLVAIKDRKARIELGAGYGRRRDSDASSIMDKEIIPNFRNDNYAKGITNGVRGIMREFAGTLLISGWVKIIVVVLIIALIAICISMFRNGKRGWGWVCVGLIIILLLSLLWMVRKTVESLPEGSGSGGFGGGFGGGFSGGGGATGSW